MRLCNPKFGLHSTVFMSGDSADSYSLPASSDQKHIHDLEYQVRYISNIGRYLYFIVLFQDINSRMKHIYEKLKQNNWNIL